MSAESGAMPAAPWRAPAGQRLRESHLHLYQFGRSLEMLDLSACGSADEMLEMVGGACAHKPAGSLVIADKARPEAWASGGRSPGWPTLVELDRVTRGEGGPVAFCGWCFDYHALMANSMGLAMGGVAHADTDPRGGIIGRDDEGGLTGVLYESAAGAFWEALPDPDLDRAEEVLMSGVDALRAHGFVGADDLKAQPWLGARLAGLADEGRLGDFAVHIWPLVEDLDTLWTTRREWERDTVRLGGGKIFVDGTLNSRTAWMLHDYADAQSAGRHGHPRGLPMMTPTQIEDAVRRCDALGVPLAAHAIGDAAVRAVLDAIEKVNPRTPGFRIEHAELVDEADVPRFAHLGVTCSVQPCHLLYDIEALRRAVPDRLDRVLPLRSLIGAGCEPGRGLIFGSDAPIVRPDPGDSVQAAVERRRVGKDADEAVGLGEAISLELAWRCFGL